MGKNTLKRSQIILGIFVILVVGSIGYLMKELYQPKEPVHTQTVAIKSVSSQILADGYITAQNQATLHFQTGGKVVYLPFKEGDTLYAGQTIAQLDTYSLQEQLTAALNNYKIGRDTFDQTQQNVQNNVTSGQQSILFGNASIDKNTMVNDAIKRIADANQANLNNSVVNVELANYALQLSTLTSPINGIILHEDITVAGQNITPAMGFTVADPSSMVFRAHVLESDIDFITLGANATITLNGKEYLGTVVKIYPTRDTQTNSYQVDIQSDGLRNGIKFDQIGNARIDNSRSSHVLLVPIWVVLSHNSIWVEDSGKPILKTVVLGNTHGAMIEVTSGLHISDKVILNPQAIASGKYQLL